MMERFVEAVSERFLRYVRINTMSSMESDTHPSTRADGGGKSIGFVAHMDTVPDYPGDNVKP